MVVFPQFFLSDVFQGDTTMHLAIYCFKEGTSECKCILDQRIDFPFPPYAVRDCTGAVEIPLPHKRGDFLITHFGMEYDDSADDSEFNEWFYFLFDCSNVRAHNINKFGNYSTVQTYDFTYDFFDNDFFFHRICK
jgi:hypothetical protein